MTTENKKDMVPPVRLDATTYARIVAEAESNFISITEVVRNRLVAAYADGDDVAPAPMSAAALARARKQEMENEILEYKLARERRELIPVALAAKIVEKDYGVIRSRLLAIPQSVLDLSSAQMADLKKTIQDVMTDLSGEQKESWDDIDV
jgi:hypothetical protein